MRLFRHLSRMHSGHVLPEGGPGADAGLAGAITPLGCLWSGGGVWASLLRLVPPRPEPRKLAGNGGMVSDVKI